MHRAIRLFPVLLVAAVVAACALDGRRDATEGAVVSQRLHALAEGRTLPAWHPPVAGWASALPEGHPPVVRMPALPEGHPPIPGWPSALPEGHPACPALRSDADRGQERPGAPTPKRVEVIRT